MISKAATCVVVCLLLCVSDCSSQDLGNSYILCASAEETSACYAGKVVYKQIYFLSFDVGIRRKICSRILRDATEGCAEDV